MQYSGGATAGAFLGLPSIEAELATLTSGEIDKATPAIYLRLDGIPGSATAKGHEGDIACFSCRWGHDGEEERGNGRPSDPDRSTVSVVKELDKATPLLYQGARGSARPKTGDVTLERPDESGSTRPYCVLGLEDVNVVSLDTGQLGDTSFERCVLDVAGLAIKYVGE